MTNAITTPTISSVVNRIQISSSFEVHEAGMIITGVPTVEEYMHLAGLLGQVRGALSWAVGDFLNSFEMHHGEMMAQTEAMFPDKSYQYLMDCKWISGKVSQERRHQGSFSAWKEVLVLNHVDQDKLLKDYDDGVLVNQKELRSAVKELKGEVKPSPFDASYGYVKKIIKELEKWHAACLFSSSALNKKHANILFEAIKILKEI